jgi:hypothetical protein
MKYRSTKKTLGAGINEKQTSGLQWPQLVFHSFQNLLRTHSFDIGQGVENSPGGFIFGRKDYKKSTLKTETDCHNFTAKHEEIVAVVGFELQVNSACYFAMQLQNTACEKKL